MSKKTSPDTRSMKRKRKRKLRKRIYFILIPLILLLSVFGYAVHLYTKAESVFSESHQDDGKEKSKLREAPVNPKENNISILIMGVDASDIRANSDSSRTDTLLVATLNKEDKSVKLLSIPRDSKVYIPEVGYEDRINHAHAFGGTDATIDTVENLLDIPIDYWFKVNFEAFIDVVDAIDGITVDVPYEFYEQDSMDRPRAIHLLPGEQDLNGEEALALARTRKLDNDIERGKRQQDIIKAIIKKSISLNSVLKYDDIIEAVGSNMTTNMEFDEMKSLISYGTSGKDLDFDTHSLDGEDNWVYEPKKKYYWKLDETALNETKEIFKQHLELDSSSLTNKPVSPSNTFDTTDSY
ncbi:transcriptional attenuator, LytR family [Oceanobacillus limi]|uniref:Transcriptional attenuator, LytR family n=1 Tax=Oceanobacillus limi TaxID=930131 RepID=A0A1I0A3J9_9BACI|nr:LCP family protein [Oceanobacillus limi]SES88680.1 transcriptional attenuator, LytR family [Oceanobacillus limi]